jgi:hypothetical protein
VKEGRAHREGSERQGARRQRASRAGVHPQELTLFAKALTRLQIEGERDGLAYTIRPLREGEAYELRRRTVN